MKEKEKNEGLSLKMRNYIEGGEINSSEMLGKTIWKMFYVHLQWI